MATPTWNQITAPNFSAGNSLIVQAMDQLTKAGEGLQGVAKDYKDTLYKRNLGAIQEYVNSAKTPEELESEGFRTGLAKLTGTMAGEYDTLAKAQIVDGAKDKLTTRALNTLNLDRGSFNFGEEQRNVQKADMTAKLYASRDNPVVYAALEAEAAAKGLLDPKASQDILVGIENLKAGRRTNEIGDATKAATIEQGNLAPVVTRHGMKIADGNLAINQKQADTAYLKALSDGGGGFTLQNGETAISDIIGGVRKIHQDALSGTSDKFSYKDMDAVDKAITKDETWPSLGLPDTATKVKELITKNPELAKLPNPVKASMYMSAVTKIREGNVFGKDDWLIQNDEKYLNAVIDAAKENTGYLTNAQRMETAALQDGANRLSRMSQGKVSYLQAYAYLQSQLGVSPLTNMSVDEKALDNIKKAGTKEGGNNVKKVNSPVLPQGGFGLQLGGNMVVNQAQTGNSLQQTALPPNVNKLISTPLDIVTNPSTIKTKPVADPLRQAALEQPPVATNNTSQPRQLPSAEIAQKERMQQTALSNLIGAKLEEKQALVRNAFPNASLTPINKATEPLSSNSIPLIQSMFKLPVATNTPKLEETKPRELTPAEKQQAERMNKADMVRLAGTKLEEKQAEVQKQFPDTPLKELAKAATPVPSPLIPVESQNAFRVKENNLALDFLTGKGTPTKEPVPMPKVTWKEPVQVVAINPIFAQLPQYTGVVTYVGDADTLLAKSNKYTTKGRENESSNIECRIDSVDAPETPHPEYGKKGQPYGEEAAKILQQMVLNKEVSIRVTKPTDGESNYGRDVCQIEVSGKDVSVELLRAGAAWLYQYKDKRTGEDYNRYGSGGIQLEQQARDANRGLWALPNPQNPYDFRQQEKRK